MTRGVQRLPTVVAAYAGADAVVVQLPLQFEPVAHTYAETILAALEKAGIARVVFNPAAPMPPEPVGVPFVDARVALARRLPAVVERASVVGPASRYLENLRQPWSVRRIVLQGEVAYPAAAELPVPWLTLDDLGDAIASTLADARPAPVRLIAGPQALTGDALAACLADAIGRPVRWVQVAPAEYAALLTPILGAAAATEIAAVYQHEATSPPPPPPADLVVAGPTSVSQWAARHDWTV